MLCPAPEPRACLLQGGKSIQAHEPACPSPSDNPELSSVTACHHKIATERLGVGEVFMSSEPQTRPEKENELKIELLLQRWEMFLPAM